MTKQDEATGSDAAPSGCRTLPETDYLPRSMLDAGVRERRRAMLDLGHMIELKNFAANCGSVGQFLISIRATAE